MEDRVRTLPLYRSDVGTTSFFQPTPEELERLNAGGIISLTQMSTVVFPFHLSVAGMCSAEEARAHYDVPGGPEWPFGDDGRPVAVNAGINASNRDQVFVDPASIAQRLPRTTHPDSDGFWWVREHGGSWSLARLGQSEGVVGVDLYVPVIARELDDVTGEGWEWMPALMPSPGEATDKRICPCPRCVSKRDANTPGEMQVEQFDPAPVQPPEESPAIPLQLSSIVPLGLFEDLLNTGNISRWHRFGSLLRHAPFRTAGALDDDVSDVLASSTLARSIAFRLENVNDPRTKELMEIPHGELIRDLMLAFIRDVNAARDPGHPERAPRSQRHATWNDYVSVTLVVCGLLLVGISFFADSPVGAVLRVTCGLAAMALGVMQIRDSAMRGLAGDVNRMLNRMEESNKLNARSGPEQDPD